MKPHAIIAAGILSIAGLSPTAAAGPCGPGGDCRCGHGGGARLGGGPPVGARMYDADTVTTLHGTASAVTVVPGRRGTGGLHVTLQSEGTAMDVHVGPTWFLQQLDAELAKGDSLEVTGSVIEMDGKPVLIAREVKKGKKVLTLRNEQGIPAWAGQRQR